jgi:hypothetical protein
MLFYSNIYNIFFYCSLKSLLPNQDAVNKKDAHTSNRQRPLVKGVSQQILTDLLQIGELRNGATSQNSV